MSNTQTPTSRIPSLNITDLNTGVNSLLPEAYNRVLENFQRRTISQVFRNQQLSGDMNSGTVEAARFANALSQPYGTARAAGKGNALRKKPVLVRLGEPLEIPEEYEAFDRLLSDLENVINNRNTNYESEMARTTENAFFTVARDAGTQVNIPSDLDPVNRLETLILKLTTLKNEFFHGIDRSMITVIMSDLEYTRFRRFLNIDTRNAAAQTAAEDYTQYGSTRVYPSIYLPDNVGIMAMANGAVAMPVVTLPFQIAQDPFSYAYILKFAYKHGATAVMPETIFWAENDGTSFSSLSGFLPVSTNVAPMPVSADFGGISTDLQTLTAAINGFSARLPDGQEKVANNEKADKPVETADKPVEVADKPVETAEIEEKVGEKVSKKK
ncbi:MAG: hypothetical protein FWG64_12950 [Firmicutes bacterium]|nr:hypothetical protein [Bacillota bacterium]